MTKVKVKTTKKTEIKKTPVVTPEVNEVLLDPKTLTNQYHVPTLNAEFVHGGSVVDGVKYFFGFTVSKELKFNCEEYGIVLNGKPLGCEQYSADQMNETITYKFKCPASNKNK